MGVGHVPQEPVRAAGEGADVQGRQRRGTPGRRTLSDPGAAKALGDRGEDLVAAWYEQRGYVVLARNWHGSRGELDLVLGRERRGRSSADGPVVVFCEVKTRTSQRFGGPAAAVGPAKQAAVRRTAIEWMAASLTSRVALRFDVACVVGDEITVLEAAF